MVVNNLPKIVPQQCLTGSQIHYLSITSLMPYSLCHPAILITGHSHCTVTWLESQ